MPSKTPNNNSTKVASAWSLEEEAEFLIRLLHHSNNGIPSLIGFHFNDRSVSSMRNKLHGLIAKYKLQSPDVAAASVQATSSAKKTSSPKKKRKAKIENDDEEDNE